MVIYSTMYNIIMNEYCKQQVNVMSEYAESMHVNRILKRFHKKGNFINFYKYKYKHRIKIFYE